MENFSFFRKSFFGIDISFSDIIYEKQILSPAQTWVTVLSKSFMFSFMKNLIEEKLGSQVKKNEKIQSDEILICSLIITNICNVIRGGSRGNSKLQKES